MTRSWAATAGSREEAEVISIDGAVVFGKPVAIALVLSRVLQAI